MAAGVEHPFRSRRLIVRLRRAIMGELCAAIAAGQSRGTPFAAVRYRPLHPSRPPIAQSATGSCHHDRSSRRPLVNRSFWRRRHDDHLGLAAMARGLADRTGLVTELPLFDGLPLPEPGDFVIGGHDIRETSFAESAEEFRRDSGVFEAEWLTACKDELAAATARVRPGTHFGAGRAISQLADWGDCQASADGPAGRRPHRRRPGRVRRGRIDRPPDRPQRRQHRAPFALGEAHQRWDALNAALADGGPELLPASSLYALAAFGAATRISTSRPAWAPRCPHSTSWLESTGSLYAGKDGKTGETLLKTVLAPMFAAAQSQGHELGRPQHLRQPRRPGPGRSGQQVVQGRDQGPRREPRSWVTSPELDRHHRVPPRHGRLEDRLGPHPFPGVPGHQDGPPVHLARLRQPAGGPAGDRPGPAGRPRKAARAAGA